MLFRGSVEVYIIIIVIMTPKKKRNEDPDPEMRDCKKPRRRSPTQEKVKLNSPAFLPSDALLKRAKIFQEKLRASKTLSVEKKKRGKKKSKQSQSNLPSQRGKNYKTKSDRKLTEPSLRTHFLKNYIYDTKNGARNARRDYVLRKNHRLGSHRPQGGVDRGQTE